jgi:hypothetical protein
MEHPEVAAMVEMIGIADIAKRIGVDGTTVRRLIARESDALQLTIHRGKGDKVLLSKDDADQLVASYEARRGAVAEPAEDTRHSTDTDIFTSFSLYRKHSPIALR